MSDPKTTGQLTKQGIAALKTGDTDTAYSLLKQATEQEPKNQDIWLWFADAARDEAEQRFALEQVITLNPASKAGQFAHKKLSSIDAQSRSNTTARVAYGIMMP